MTRIQPAFRRVLLALLSLLSLIFIAQSLFSTADLPQAPTLVDLLQTDLALQASTWKTDDPNLAQLQQVVLEKDPLKAYEQALESYESVRQSNFSNSPLSSNLDSNLGVDLDLKDSQLSQQIDKDRHLSELDLRIGILQALSKSQTAAQKSWNQVSQRSDSDLAKTSQLLAQIWAIPDQILPKADFSSAESLIKDNLDRWSESFALEKLYLIQKRSPELKLVLAQRQTDSLNAIVKLATATAVPIIGGLGGLVLWIVLLTQRLIGGQSAVLRLGDRAQIISSVSWGAEKTWEIMVLWFACYVVISNLLPLLLLLFSSTINELKLQISKEIFQAIAGVFIPYCLTMLPMLPITKFSLPPSQTWLNLNFKSLNWIGWGIGGYFAAVPLVLIASTLSEKIWQGQGGSNPLLPILTESQDSFAKVMLWVTLAIAAPFFEEYLFRGFLFSSFAKLMPIPGALLLSGLCFAIVHLNLGDIIPLTVLGVVLGFVYLKSKNLLAPILLHCLWNSGSFISLLALGA